jgi:hypothetical protein
MKFGSEVMPFKGVLGAIVFNLTTSAILKLLRFKVVR